MLLLTQFGGFKMGKIRTAFRQITAATLKSKASIPAQTDITVVGNTIDCVNISLTQVKNVIGALTFSVYDVCRHDNVNVWSQFGPTIRSYSGVGTWSAALVNSKPTECRENSGADQLLKRAAEKLRLSIKDTQNIRKISETIAQLDHSQYIGAEHVSEAIQYCKKISKRDGAIDPESHEKCFGFGIKISLFDIDAYDINNAIKYLKSRK